MSTSETITKTDLKNILEAAGNIGSVDSTATPTAGKVSEFDANAQINSTDMTAAEVEDFVDAIVEAVYGASSSTYTPTADTPARFNESANMESTDMTSAELTQFVAGLNINGDGIPYVLYVIEYGTDNSWDYRKWSDGTYEAWRTYQATGLNCTTSSAGTYYGGSATLSFPSFHTHWLQGFGTNGPSQSSGVYIYQVSSNNGFRIDYRAHASSSNASCGGSFYLRGQWVD